MATTNAEGEKDCALIAGIAAGNAQAFDDLYKRYESRIYRYFRQFVPADKADDLWQQVMMAVWEGAGDFKRRSTVRTWIYGIARLIWLGALRQGKREGPRSLSLEEREEYQPHQSIGEHNLGRRVEQQDLIQKATAKLSPEHREVLYLTYWEGMSYEEIAVLTGTKEATVKTRAWSAREMIKKELKTLESMEGTL